MLNVTSPEPAVRRFSAGAATVLHRLSGVCLDLGNVNLVALDAVASAFGSRWPAKRDQVYHQVGRVLERALGESGFCARVSPTDFLVVQPTASAFGAQALCYRCFREIWAHFLGDAPEPSVAVHCVTGLSASEITAVEVDAGAAMAREAQEIAIAQGERRRLEPQSRPHLNPLRWAPFVASNGRRVDVICQPEPVFSIKTKARVAIRLAATVVDLATGEALRPPEVDALNRSDLFRIHMCTLSRGLELMRGAAGLELSLVVPASYIVLSHPPSRQTLIRALGELRALVEAGVILEVRDLVGAPQAALAELLLTIRDKCLLVVAHLSAEKPPRNIKDVGFHAVSVSCPGSLKGDAAFISWIQRWTKSAQLITRSVMIYGCSTPNRIGVATSVGATHYSTFSSQSGRVGLPITERPARCELDVEGSFR